VGIAIVLQHRDPVPSLSDLRILRRALLLALLWLTSPSLLAEHRLLIQNKGSDTLFDVAQAWAEAYKEVNQAVAVAVSGGGTGTGVAALIHGTVDLANASRPLEAQELQLAAAHGQHPMEHVVGYDALVVFLHRDNPTDAFSIDQLARIFGRGGAISRWSELGVRVPGCRDQMVVISRQNNSGTYAYFKKAVLKTAAKRGVIDKGSFRLGTLDLHGSKDVVDLVARTPCAIGYSGLAYATDRVKMACVAMEQGSPCVPPSVATASDGRYAIARPLLMYTNGPPQGPIKEYLDWILSDAGQCILRDKGYAPAHELACPNKLGTVTGVPHVAP
jgi:phosphate transport system substrate-binding protein